MRSSSRPAVIPADPNGSPLSRWAPGDLGGTERPAGGGGAGRNAHGAHSRACRSARDADARAAAELSALVEGARASGYEAGVADGREMESERLNTVLATVHELVARLEADEAQWQASALENVAALAVAVARHIIGRELRGDAEPVADLVRRAVAEFPIDQPVRIRAHPADLSLLASPSGGDGAVLPVAPGRNVQWMADGRIEPGGCIVEGRERIVDGRVDTALERMYRRLATTNA